MRTRLKKIGIFGGSFDPPHLGHLIIAELARRSLDLDVVFLVPAYRPPHKAGTHASSARDRLAMTKLSIRGNAGLRVSDIEIRRRGVSYTVDTVKAFHRKFLSSDLYLIIGSDSLKQFHSWKQPEEILSRATLIVYRRPGQGRKKPRIASGKVVWIKGPMVELASSDIRDRILRGKSIHYMVRENVLTFIRRKRLYSRPVRKP
jgi:nicotinate-nucleotide adenylyltransferase